MDPTGDLVSATGELLEALRRLLSESEMMGASVSEAPDSSRESVSIRPLSRGRPSRNAWATRSFR